MSDSHSNDAILASMTRAASNKSKINPELYTKYNVKRGLRNNDGTGVLVGLTEVGEVMSYIVDDAERVPVEGKLFYRGYEVTDLVNGFYQKRFGYEEIAFLLMTGELPTEQELIDFNQLLSSRRPLPAGFTEDMILKAPSPDVMNKLARSVLALYSYDENPDSVDLKNVYRQCVELIARFPVLISYGYMARRHYVEARAFSYMTLSLNITRHRISFTSSDLTVSSRSWKPVCLILPWRFTQSTAAVITLRLLLMQCLLRVLTHILLSQLP